MKSYITQIYSICIITLVGSGAISLLIFGFKRYLKSGRVIHYKDKMYLLNNSERILFNRLNEIVNPNGQGELYVLSQVGMSQLFCFKNGWRDPGLNEISRKNIDFLICRKRDMQIIVAIELNGPHHGEEKQMRRDIKKKYALESAGIPFLIYTSNNLPNTEKLIEDLKLSIRKRAGKIKNRKE